ncbi:MAG: PRC-barrel domain-containing protein [Nitrospirales bacterium]
MKNFYMYVFWVMVGLVGAPFSQSLAEDSIKGAYKASELVGKSVKNLQGDDLGSVEEIVIETTGEAGYVVLTFGGFLGVGDKLFAVPWTALAHSPNGEHLTLDMEPKKLEKAPGFNKDNWPDMQDENWRLVIFEFYEVPDTSEANQRTIRAKNVKSGKMESLPDHKKHAHFSAKKGYLVGGEGKTGNSVRYDGSKIWEGPSYAVVDVDPTSNQGVVMGIVRTHDHTYTILFTEFIGKESFMNGGIATDLNLHGTTGQGAPLFPKVSAPVAGWGKATVFKDDEILYKQYPAHFMLTEGIRDKKTHQVHFLEPDRLKSFIVASGKESSTEVMQSIKKDIQASQEHVNPETLQLHIVAHSTAKDKENIPPFDEFIHFMWDRVTWETDK